MFTVLSGMGNVTMRELTPILLTPILPILRSVVFVDRVWLPRLDLCVTG